MQAGGRRFEPVCLHQNRVLAFGVESSLIARECRDRTLCSGTCDSGAGMVLSGKFDLCQCESVGAYLCVLFLWVGLTLGLF